MTYETIETYIQRADEDIARAQNSKTREEARVALKQALSNIQQGYKELNRAKRAEFGTYHDRLKKLTGEYAIGYGRVTSEAIGEHGDTAVKQIREAAKSALERALENEEVAEFATDVRETLNEALDKAVPYLDKGRNALGTGLDYAGRGARKAGDFIGDLAERVAKNR